MIKIFQIAILAGCVQVCTLSIYSEQLNLEACYQRTETKLMVNPAVLYPLGGIKGGWISSKNEVFFTLTLHTFQLNFNTNNKEIDYWS